MLWIGVLGLAIGASVQAQESAPQAADLEAFGELPVRFNSRVTTFERVARNAVLYLSGQPELHTADGELLDPVRWLLDLAAGRPEALDVPMLRVEGRELHRLVLPGEEPREFKLIPLSHLRSNWNRLVDEYLRAGQLPISDQTEFHKALFLLMNSGWALIGLQDSLRIADSEDWESTERTREFDRSREDATVPLCVPPEELGDPWRTLGNASLEVLLSEVEERSAGQVAGAIVEVVRAHAAGDPVAFNAKLVEYRKQLEELKTTASPLRYEVPAGWIELGVPRVLKDWFYGDAGARGCRIAAFEIRHADEKAWVNLNHFPNGVPDRTRLVNQWRLELGLPPLTARQVRSSGRAVSVASLEGRGMEFRTPASLPLKKTATVSVSLSHPAGMTEFSLYGSAAAVREHRAEFDAFIASVRLGGEESVRAWLAAEPGVDAPTFQGLGFRAAVVPDGARLWVFRTTCRADCAAKSEDRLLEVVGGASFPFWGPAGIRLKLPDGMREVEGFGATFTRIHFDVGFEGQEHPHQIDVQPIATWGLDCVPRLVNLWRTYLGLDPAADSKLREMFRPLDPEDESAGVLVAFAGPPFPERAPAESADPEIEYDVPAGWQRVEPGVMSLASLTFEEDGEMLDLAVIRLAGTAGGLHANVNRFRAQVGLEPLTEEQIDRDIRPITVLGKVGQLYEAVGEERTVVSVYIADNDATWFVRLKGPKGLAAGQRTEFEEFLGSLRFKER